MDTNEWVILSDDGFLDGDEKQIFLGKRNSGSKSVFDNYFCTSPKSRKTTEASRVVPKQLVHVPIQLEPRIGKVPDGELIEENTEDHVGVTLVPSATTTETEKIKAPQVGEAVVEADQDTVSQVFFQIMENKFVDMKMDSPKSSGRGLFPPLDVGALNFEDQGEAMEIMTSPRMKKIEQEKVVIMDCDREEEDSTGGFNFWKWSLTGVGAICSFGVAAATICVLFFGSQQRNKLKQDQNIRFQIYTDDKRIKQVVQHATKLNEAIAAARGVPLSRAHITYGGYYDGL